MKVKQQDNALTPLLKWPGGKRWFRGKFAEIAPSKYNRYIEPFLGSGSIFFSERPESALLGDLNAEIVDMYWAVKTAYSAVESKLIEHQKNHSTEYYYKVRDSKPRSIEGKAARTLYLNRTCFNGIYRVNLEGKFNVPIGTKSSVLLETDDFAEIARSLQCAELIAGDFENLIDKATEGDLVFADPPYTVRHNLNGFVKYNEKLFSWADQKRLAAALERAANRNAYVISTNAYHDSVKRLYWGKQFKMSSLSRYSSISSKSATRIAYQELLIISKNINHHE
jgi:DNA adenine methylase